MMMACCCLGMALVIASPTNAPAAFSTEMERTFSVPDIAEQNVWLDGGIHFTASPSNRIEIALGPDRNGDGQLGDDEAPFAFAVDCGRMIVRDGKGDELYSGDAFDAPIRLSFVPARRGAVDAWKVGFVDEPPLAGGEFPEDLPSLATWNLARVRMSGARAATARVSLRRNRAATVFVVR